MLAHFWSCVTALKAFHMLRLCFSWCVLCLLEWQSHRIIQIVWRAIGSAMSLKQPVSALVSRPWAQFLH